jgi:Zn ribbon nucleic-acid-binding protein
LKCLGEVSNTIFSALLEFVNQLLPDDGEALPDNTYQAKKFLRDMGLGHEKIPACRNDCMLFWNDNKHLNSCIKCGQSKWKDEVDLDDDGHPILASKKRPAKVAEVVHVAAYRVQYEMACKGLHKRWGIKASGRRRSMEVVR